MFIHEDLYLIYTKGIFYLALFASSTGRVIPNLSKPPKVVALNAPFGKGEAPAKRCAGDSREV